MRQDNGAFSIHKPSPSLWKAYRNCIGQPHRAKRLRQKEKRSIPLYAGLQDTALKIKIIHSSLERALWFNCSRHYLSGKIHAISTNRKTNSATDGALNVSRTAGEFYEVKLTGRNCMDAISTRLRGPFQSGLGSIGFRFYLLLYRNRPECAGKDRA